MTESNAPTGSYRRSLLFFLAFAAIIYPLSMGPVWAFVDWAFPLWSPCMYLAVPYIPLMLVVEGTRAEEIMRKYIELWTGMPVGPLRQVRW